MACAARRADCPRSHHSFSTEFVESTTRAGVAVFLLMKRRPWPIAQSTRPSKTFWIAVQVFPARNACLPFPDTHPTPLPIHQLEVTEVSPTDTLVDTVDADGDAIMAEDKGGGDASRSRPPRPGDSQGARSNGLAGDAHAGSAAGVKEGAATDQEEGGGGQRNRGRATSTQSGKPSWSKVEEELSVLRIGGMMGADGVSSGGDGVDHRGRQDSSRSPLPHDNGAGGEDDASVLDTPLQEKVRLAQ